MTKVEIVTGIIEKLEKNYLLSAYTISESFSSSVAGGSSTLHEGDRPLICVSADEVIFDKDKTTAKIKISVCTPKLTPRSSNDEICDIICAQLLNEENCDKIKKTEIKYLSRTDVLCAQVKFVLEITEME